MKWSGPSNRHTSSAPSADGGATPRRSASSRTVVDAHRAFEVDVELGLRQGDQISHRPMVASDAWERGAAPIGRRSVALLGLALLTATACVGGGTGAEDPAARAFTRADVDAIVLGPDDALDGTTYVEDASGFHELDAFARDDVERGHLVDDGFEIGHVALFLPPDSVDGDPTADERQRDRPGDRGAVPRRRRSRELARALRRGPALAAGARRDRRPRRTGSAISRSGCGARRPTERRCRSSRGGSRTCSS